MLTLQAAQRVVETTITKAGELGIAVSVAIVDAAGRVKQISRMDGAGWLTPDIATGKACAASAFRRDTTELVQRFSTNQLFANSLPALSGGKLAIGGGGLVIQRGGEILGGIGVSGGTPEQDIECGRAGLTRLEG